MVQIAGGTSGVPMWNDTEPHQQSLFTVGDADAMAE